MKAKKLLQMLIIIIVSYITAIVAWQVDEWYKRYTSPLKMEEAELVFKRDFERANRIRHIQNLLWGLRKGIVDITRQAEWDLKDELHRLLGDSKPVKTYAGVWHKTYLEVIK